MSGLVIAMGGGGFSMEPDNPKLDDFVLSCSQKQKPRVCFVPTASGDAASYTEAFYVAFKDRRCQPTHVSLFHREVPDLESFVLAQDIFYVGGGNTANLVAIWRAHGFDKLLNKAWQRGAILAGLSAGALCWFDCGVTDSFGALARLDCLGFIEGSFCPHYDGEAQRRPVFTGLIAGGELPAGHAADDGAALVFEGTTLREAVASRPNAQIYHIERRAGAAHATAVPTRRL